MTPPSTELAGLANQFGLTTAAAEEVVPSTDGSQLSGSEIGRCTAAVAVGRLVSLGNRCCGRGVWGRRRVETARGSASDRTKHEDQHDGRCGGAGRLSPGEAARRRSLT